MTRQQHDACGGKAEQVTGGPSDEPWGGGDSNTCELAAHGFRFLSPICLVRKGLLLRCTMGQETVQQLHKAEWQVVSTGIEITAPPDAAFSLCQNVKAAHGRLSSVFCQRRRNASATSSLQLS